MTNYRNTLISTAVFVAKWYLLVVFVGHWFVCLVDFWYISTQKSKYSRM